ncbi:hypothetical protein PPYR_02949 [Photinus pyralis]|uniref:Myb-like domain-containing protein n=1 Tax=Photinus pyralis TaxID=7054 RepID=A0A5N4A1I0_PHOPY|nr:trihelix transcription factor GT-3b-like [Photinus pyralis]XP_031328004.1 trihelix transcription factor GT-3b-like [Photinus pyralis]XP_031331764.1 trihelix transcription factor GT-3b-like [Photinus pyralis]KAB0791149.1 hypothetical protein PPYR_02949 [Photinus pyralis]
MDESQMDETQVVVESQTDVEPQAGVATPDNETQVQADRAFWSNNEILALMHAYDNLKENFDHPKKRKHVWDDVSNLLLSQGIHRTPKSCEIKWRNLVRTYKTVRDNVTKSGRGATRFQYYEAMNDILGNKPSMSCAHTISVGAEMERPENLGNVTATTPEPTPSTSRATETETPKKKPRSSIYAEYLKKKNSLQEEKFNMWRQEIAARRNDRERKRELEERKVVAFEKYVEYLRKQ